MLTEDNKIRILKLFFEGPNERLHLREVARRVGLSATGAMKNLRVLEKESLLEKEHAAVTVVYRGNYDNVKFIALKRKISLHLIDNIKNEEKDFINTLANGIVIYGYLEVI